MGLRGWPWRTLVLSPWTPTLLLQRTAALYLTPWWPHTLWAACFDHCSLDCCRYHPSFRFILPVLVRNSPTTAFHSTCPIPLSSFLFLSPRVIPMHWIHCCVRSFFQFRSRFLISPHRPDLTWGLAPLFRNGVAFLRWALVRYTSFHHTDFLSAISPSFRLLLLFALSPPENSRPATGFSSSGWCACTALTCAYLPRSSQFHFPFFINRRWDSWTSSVRSLQYDWWSSLVSFYPMLLILITSGLQEMHVLRLFFDLSVSVSECQHGFPHISSPHLHSHTHTRTQLYFSWSTFTCCVNPQLLI